MNLIDNIFARSANEQVAMYEAIARYREQEAAYAMLTAQIQNKSAELMLAQLQTVQQRPSLLLKPQVEHDEIGNQWTCAYSGVVGYGPTPEQAVADFDKLWTTGHSSSDKTEPGFDGIQ
jgi:hypothetical protein